MHQAEPNHCDKTHQLLLFLTLLLQALYTTKNARATKVVQSFVILLKPLLTSLLPAQVAGGVLRPCQGRGQLGSGRPGLGYPHRPAHPLHQLWQPLCRPGEPFLCSTWSPHHMLCLH